MRVLSTIFLLLLSAGFVQAGSRDYEGGGDPGSFLGSWRNVETQESQVTRIVIKPNDDGEGFCVEVYGLYQGEPTVFGVYRGRIFESRYPRDREQDNAAVLVKIQKPWVRGSVLLRFNGRGEIVAHALLHREDWRGEGDIYKVDRFAPAGVPYSDDYRGRQRYWR